MRTQIFQTWIILLFFLSIPSINGRHIFDLSDFDVEDLLNKNLTCVGEHELKFLGLPEIYYQIDISKNVQNFSDILVKILEKCPSSPKLILGLKHQELQIILKADDVVHYYKDLNSMKLSPALAPHLEAVIANQARLRTCGLLMQKELEFLNISQLYTTLRHNLSDETRQIKFGYGYHNSLSGCVLMAPHLTTSDVLLTEINFGDVRTSFPESYSLFSSLLNQIYEQNLELSKRSEGRSAPEFLYKLSLQVNQRLPRRNWRLEKSYFNLFTQFSQKWASQAKSTVIIPPDLYDEDIPTELADLRTILIPVMTTFQPEEPGVDQKAYLCSHYLPDVIQGTLANFQSYFVNLDQWKDILHCGESKNETSFLGHLENLVVSLSCEQIGAEDIPKLIERYFKTESEALTFLVHKNCSQFLLSKSMTKSKSEFGDKLRFGVIFDTYTPFIKFHFKPEMMTMSPDEDVQETLFEILSVVVWQLNFDTGDRAKFRTPYEHYNYVLQHHFHKVFVKQQEFQENHPDKQIILQVLDKSQRDDLQSNVYCNEKVAELKFYTEAVVTWARLVNISVIFKRVTQSGAKSSQSDWWKYLHFPKGLAEPKHVEFVARDFPQEMEDLGLTPCLSKSADVSRSGIPVEGSLLGATINFTEIKGSLANKEMKVMLQLAFHKFDRVQIILENEENIKQIVNILGDDSFFPGLETNSTTKTIFIQVPLKTLLLLKPQTLHHLSKLKSNRMNFGGLHLFLENYNEIGHLPNANATLKKIKGLTKASIGIALDSCVSVLDSLNSGNDTGILRFFNHISCQEDVITANNENELKMSTFLDSHLYTKKLIGRYVPEMGVYFQVSTRSSQVATSETEQNRQYLTFMSDIQKFSSFNQINYFVSTGFGTSETGWWTLSDRSDFGNTATYFERESEFLNRTTWRPKETPPPSKSGWGTPEISLLVAGFTLLVTSVVAILILVRNRRLRYLSAEEEEDFLNGVEIEGLVGEELYKSLKFDPKFHLTKTDVSSGGGCMIGMGEFGTVHKALIHGLTCAVKVPRAGVSKDAFRSMLCELKVLCYVGNHDNIIAFVGAYTKEIRKGIIYIATEFCENGSLQFFLRQMRAKLENTNELVLHPGHPVFYELLRFSEEIASGLAYLTQKLVVHGDLATRNVLLNADKTCKIADFGLSRKLYRYLNEQYVKTGEDPLPWRWMSVEALKDLQFSTMSDVWSYGVTVWEIFALGDLPYPESTFEGFVQYLESGQRLSAPEFGTPEIYELMCTCWKSRPESRPSIRRLLDTFRMLRKMEYTTIEEQ